ncbi:hypothetical protein DY000_02022943 [Brassica cretica]|uniref:Uncharacterized protein n=1 Tax=Brassica cretica TaxID=69181 RepID=A0ABQ7EJA4_BRACR|nr:hypothetical protein DY000_02022943 [Brassica cretica]
MQMMRFEALDDTHAVRKLMCLSLKCMRVTQLLLLLFASAEIFHWSCIKQLKHYMLASPVSHLSAASDVFLVFCIVPYRDHQRFLESSPSHKVFKSKMRMGVWPPPLLSFSSRQVLRSPRRAVLGWANIFKSGVIGEAKIIGFQLSVQLVLSFCGKRSDDLVKPLVNGNGSAVSALLRLDRVCV